MKLANQPQVLILTEEAAIEAFGKAKAAVEAKAEAAILRDNSKATDVFISGITDRDSVWIEDSPNGLYSPSQETGHDGRILYMHRGDLHDFCIEHFEGQWQVKNEMDRGSGVCCAFVQGNCALEDCCSRGWHVVYGDEIVSQPDVKIVTGQQAKSKASSNIILAP